MSGDLVRGAFIVIEGLDRAGKSTQHNLLCTELESEGYNVKRMRFPDRSTAIGQSIDAYLRGVIEMEDHAIHLLFSANRWEAAKSIEEAITMGTTVVVDRYYYSGAVYSAAKSNTSLSLHWARQPDIGLPRPDMCIFLDIAGDTAVSRGGYGAERYEHEEIQGKVKSLFQEMFISGNEREDVEIIDAGRKAEQVFRDIWAVFEKIMTSNRLQTPLRSYIG